MEEGRESPPSIFFRARDSVSMARGSSMHQNDSKSTPPTAFEDKDGFQWLSLRKIRFLDKFGEIKYWESKPKE